MTIIKVKSVLEKVSQKGSIYHRVNDEFNIFEADHVKIFEDNLGKNVEIEMRASKCGKYQNLVSVSPTDEQESAIQVLNKPNTAPLAPLLDENAIRAMIKEIVAEKPLKQNSRTWGKGDDQLKLYFDTAIDLQEQLEELRQLKLVPECLKPIMKEPKIWDKETVLKRE